jgi:hypothetical protein
MLLAICRPSLLFNVITLLVLGKQLNKFVRTNYTVHLFTLL